MHVKKITILALHLGYGGIEKCISTLANSLSKNYHVEIISTYKLYEEPAFPLNGAIQVQYLLPTLKPNKIEFLTALKTGHIIKAYQELKIALKILKLKKKKMIETIQSCESDAIISTRDIHNIWLGKYGKKEAYKIGWEHNHPQGNKKYIKKIVNSVKKLDAFVVVSKELYVLYKKYTKCPCFYIPNALEELPQNKANRMEKRLVSIGRLSSEKGYQDLIDVFALVHKKQPDWHLEIIGDGIERKAIEKKIQDYNLSNHVILHGFQNKKYINKILEQSSIYLMTSHRESFGIVLLEAFSYGLPCIAFDRAQGARELISDNWDGYLIENHDKEQMTKRICDLIKNQNRRIIMGDNGYKKAQKYQIDEIEKEWISLLEKEKL